MNLIQLKYFKVVAELEHITNAAKVLHISQPSLSKIIGSLEEEIGYSLFDRTGKYIKLNANGALFLKYVNKSLSALSDGEKALKYINEQTNLTVTISIMAAGKLMTDIILGFKNLHPDIKLNLINIGEDEFNDSDCDLLLFTSLDNNESDSLISLYKEDLLLALPNNHILSSEKSLNLNQVKDEPFVSTEKGSSYSNMTIYYCNVAGFEPNIAIEAQYSSVIKGLVKAGVGIAIIPELTWEESYDSGISFHMIKNPKCSRYIKLRWKSYEYENKAVNILRTYIINFFNDYRESRNV